METTHFESLYPANTRESEISKILSFIKEGNSCQVISLPGGGRSNLLGLLAYNRNVRLKHLGENQKWFHFVLSNFAEIRNKPLTEAIKFLFLSLIDSMYARHSGKRSASRISNHSEGFWTSQNDERAVRPDDIKTLREIFSESIVGNDELILFQGIKRAIDFLAIEKELTIVFLFDKFEDYIPTVTPEFFTNLRVLRDRAKYRFSVVFSTHKPLEDLIGQDLLSDFYQFVAGHTVYLPLLDKPGLEFRIAYMEKVSGKTLDKKLIDDILGQTAGHPNLTRLGVEAMLDSPHPNPLPRGERERERVKKDNAHFLSHFFLSQKPIRNALSDIWKSLTPAEQTLLTSSHPSFRHSGNQAKPEHPESEILKQVQNDKRDAGQTRMTGNESYDYLNKIGLIKNNKTTIPLFEQFIKKEVVQTLSERKQKIAFDPNTNDITKGDLMLSDTLTSSEFKLLSLLLQNPQKIIERDEIISVVWANTKSTAGVTDQALDQLIFRVRKKIEDDPNKPAHLQTVKGRGFRFIQ